MDMNGLQELRSHVNVQIVKDKLNMKSNKKIMSEDRLTLFIGIAGIIYFLGLLLVANHYHIILN